MEIDVQSFVVATAEGLLHECRVGVGGPAVVYGPGCRDEFEGDVGGAVEAGEDGDLGEGFLSTTRVEEKREGRRKERGEVYLGSDHGGPHAGWVVILLVDCGDEMDICLHHDGRTRLSLLLAMLAMP